MYLRKMLMCASAAISGMLVGCGAPYITTEDVIVSPGQPAHFLVYADREYMKASVPGVQMGVYVDGKLVGRAITDIDGVASVRADVGGGFSRYEVRGHFEGNLIAKQGRIFHWDPNRTAVAVDVDDTISHTDYAQLFMTDLDTGSRPFAYSPQILRAMNGSYEIVYVSARPRWLHEKTRVWLNQHCFPPGPILHASKFEACLAQGQYKKAMMARFQREYPNLLIGVGDKMADDVAYGDNRMLGVILGPDRGYRDHCVVLPDWQHVGTFFAEHRDRLTNVGGLAAAINANGDNLRAMFEGTPPSVSAAQNTAVPSRAVVARSPAPVATAKPSRLLVGESY